MYNVSSWGFANVYDATWGYVGTQASNVDYSGRTFRAYRQGKLTFVGGNYTLSADPYARLKGYADGSFYIFSKGDGY